MQELKNEQMRVQIEERGAELFSVQKDGVEYLWTGDGRYWEDRSPILFPIVGRLYEKEYRLNGETYRIGLHGFAREKMFALRERSETHLLFELQEDEDTLAEYPFRFSLGVRYELVGSCLKVFYEVENRGEERMYFGLGGHPGFRIPLEEGLEFTDYQLTFEKSCRPKRVRFSDDCLLTGEREGFPLMEERRLPLRHELFDEDAIVLTDTCGEVFLGAEKGKRGIRCSYEEFPYLGIWHTTGEKAPFVCLEPWMSLPGREKVVEDLEKKEDMLCLKPGKAVRKRWEMEFI